MRRPSGDHTGWLSFAPLVTGAASWPLVLSTTAIRVAPRLLPAANAMKRPSGLQAGSASYGATDDSRRGLAPSPSTSQIANRPLRLLANAMREGTPTGDQAGWRSIA